MARDIPEPCDFPSLDICQKRTHKVVDLASHPVVYLVFQAGDAEKIVVRKKVLSKSVSEDPMQIADVRLYSLKCTMLYISPAPI